MTAAILNSANIASAGTFTAAAGSSRRVVAIGHARRNTGTPTYSATFGGNAMTLDQVTALQGDDQLMVFSIAEANILSGAQTLTVTAAGGTILIAFHGQIYTLGNRDQVTVLDSGFTSTQLASAATGITSASLTNAAHSCLLGIARDSTSDTITQPTGWTIDRVDNTSGQAVPTHLDDAAANTATYLWTSGVSGNWMLLTVAYPQAAGSTTLSAAAGSFALTGENATLGVVMPAAVGSFALSGEPATLPGDSGSQTLLAAPGAFFLTGGIANNDLQLDGDTGAFALTGIIASLPGNPGGGSVASRRRKHKFIQAH